MLRLPKFEYFAPKTLGQTLKMLTDHGPDAMLVAGGTDVYPKMKRKQFQPKVLIGLRGIKRLSGIQGSKTKGFIIKAGTSLGQVATHSVIKKIYPGLATAAGVISTPILRNMGTIGGNLCLDTRCNYYDQTHEWRKAIGWCKKAPGDGLTSANVPCRVAPGSPRCWAVSSTDSAPMLIALGAQVTLVSAQGERTVPASALYRDDGMHYLTKQPDEILTEIHLPPANGMKSAYLKLRRRGAFDFPVLGAAVALRLAEDNVIQDVNIVVGGIASYPMNMETSKQLLVGKPYSEEIVKAASQAAFGPARPMDNTDYHLFYRKRMVPVYIERAIREAMGS
jgi:4-hydroxybenzoyl-CoA reductase subunit beta